PSPLLSNKAEQPSSLPNHQARHTQPSHARLPLLCVLSQSRYDSGTMKSERRHALETNQLAASMASLPELLRVYGSRILLAVALIVLVAIFVFTRISASRTAAAEAANALAFTRERLQSLRQFEPLAF